MNDFNKEFEKVMIGIYLTYHNNKPLWLEEWEFDNDRVYSDALKIDDFKLKPIFSIFISTVKDEINYIARARKDRNVVTGKTRVFFEKVLMLKRPISLPDVLSNTSAPMKASLNKMVASDLSMITANRWNAINSHLFNNDKEQHELMKLVLRKESKKPDNSNRTIITNHEKDAIGLCLRIGGINNQFNNIAKWDSEKTSTPDFLKGITHAFLREDQIIINDFKVFSDWQIVSEYKNNVAIFSDGINRVSVMNVNRTPIESTLGVDLFYYNHTHNNYIFVQYKRLKTNGSTAKYYINNDSSFLNEINRMTEIENKFRRYIKPLQSLDDYRLSDEMFYFKFCRDKQEIFSHELSKGMYLPKSYIIEIVERFKINAISYENINKYFNNTMFIEMVKTGMFGSRNTDSTELSKLINQIVENGKSVIIAVGNRAV